MNLLFKSAFKGIMRGFKNLLSNQRMMAFILVGVIGINMAFAASDPFAEIAGKISEYQDSVQNLLYAIAAIVAIVGGFNIYHKMVNGDQDVKKTAMLTIGGCIAMVALSTALPAFFGH